MRSLLVCLALVAAGNVWSDIKLPPAAKNTVFKCQINGRAHYSDTPCPGAVEVDVTPTRGIHSMSGTKRINPAVEREIAQERLAAAWQQQVASQAASVAPPTTPPHTPQANTTSLAPTAGAIAANVSSVLTTTVLQALLPLLWLLPIVVVLWVLKMASFKGWLGEFIIKQLLKKRSNSIYEVHLHNVTLPCELGTTQIDHIVLNAHGIFVVETKHYQGDITGSEHDSHWTQTLDKRQYAFQNPLRQNYAHIQALQEVLQLPSSVFHSIIVFTGPCRLRSKFPANVCKHQDFLKQLSSFKKTILTHEQLQSIHNQLKLVRLPPTRATHRTHVRNLRKRHEHINF